MNSVDHSYLRFFGNLRVAVVGRLLSGDEAGRRDSTG